MTDNVVDRSEPVKPYNIAQEAAFNTLYECALDKNFHDASLQPYLYRLPYFEKFLTDRNFSKLTPDFENFSDNATLEIEFLQDCFRVSSKLGSNSQNETYKYEHYLFPILEDIENGSISKMLAAILIRYKIGYTNGKIFTKITDYRIQPETVHYYELEVTKDFLLSALPDIHALDSEKSFNELSCPQICTDPSVDVARFNSMVDWKEKMWKPVRFEDYHFITPEKPFEVKKSDIPVKNVQNAIDTTLFNGIRMKNLNFQEEKT